MSNKEKIVQLLDSVPEYKMGYILAYVQGITADEEDSAITNKLCDDPFYSAENQARLLISKERMEKNGGTAHELIEVDDD